MVRCHNNEWTPLPSKPPTSQTITIIRARHDTTRDRADRPERMIPPSGAPRGRTHDPETITVETNAVTTQQQETAGVSQNTRPSNIVVPEDTREHGPMTTRSGRVVRPVDRLN
ncbi:hypothetical protein NP493_1267g00060 [Ridgeia piscesae]|uniref:Uncharacterized protein n=1 Tax=Ridgeia piscesae TaxID=27915 RepID=A0AAD9NGE2_RIDPI|nr:hypothetical protein NP493_1267g00060 [Ridgeia piscesae]